MHDFFTYNLRKFKHFSRLNREEPPAVSYNEAGSSKISINRLEMNQKNGNYVSSLPTSSFRKFLVRQHVDLAHQLQQFKIEIMEILDKLLGRENFVPIKISEEEEDALGDLLLTSYEDLSDFENKLTNSEFYNSLKTVSGIRLLCVDFVVLIQFAFVGSTEDTQYVQNQFIKTGVVSEKMSQPEMPPCKEEQDNRNADTKIGFFESNGCSDIGGDAPPNEACVTILDVVSLVFSIVTHFLDMGLDINLAIRYYLDSQIMYFAWTLAFIIFPNIVITIISLRMQYQDREMIPENSIERRDIIATRVFAQRRSYCEFLLLCQMTPVLHYYDSLIYALKSRSYKKMGNRKGERHYYLKMLKEDQDIALLRVFECFLEAAPQQILQITIFLRAREDRFSFSLLHQAASVISSLISMGWAMASYHRNIRLAQLDKTKIDIIGTILQFLWHFFITVSRIISVSVIASVWPLYTAIGCALHWIAMTSWLVAEPYGVTEFCRNRSHAPHTPLTIRERVGSLLFACVLGIVYIFTYLNPTEGRTFLRHLFYYVVCLFENVLASMLWAFVSTDAARAHWFFRTFVALCIIPFLFGIAAMVSYYKWFHPSSTKRKTTTNIMLKPS